MGLFTLELSDEEPKLLLAIVEEDEELCGTPEDVDELKLWL